MAALHPLAQRLEKRGLSRSWSVALALLLLVLGPLCIILLIAPLAINDVQTLARDLPGRAETG